ncbi:hypothetical protein SXIM_31390 [Streptomyces xiamenensis]|uniref:Uncharacterized protein n=1 Tax=Streptomyces xiamenensis TaxID=408015 RepID=A0A0F7FW85_9ACTN|nr:hypothetical protein SXIM_31390 [Streptomyces xiamenensis]
MSGPGRTGRSPRTPRDPSRSGWWGAPAKSHVPDGGTERATDLAFMGICLIIVAGTVTGLSAAPPSQDR